MSADTVQSDRSANTSGESSLAYRIRHADRPTMRRRAPHVVALLILAAGADFVARSDAGLQGWSILVGLLSVVPLYLVGRGWRLPLWLQLGAAALPVSIIVIATAHAEWIGGARAARYAFGAVTLLAVIAWATTPRRRLAIGLIGAWIVLDQYATAWFPWWGGEQPDKLMWGTFYWHNQFGIFCVAGAAIGLMIAALTARWTSLLAAIAVVFSATGVLASGSRASIVLLVAVFVVAAVLVTIARGWRGLVHVAAIGVASLVVASVMSSALFFPYGVWPWQSVEARGTASEAMEGSGITRFGFWGAALQIGAHYPIVGGGLSSYRLASQCYSLSLYSSNPHNEWLLEWAEGGVVGVLPLLAVLIAMVIVVIRSVRTMFSPAALRSDPARWGGLIAAVALVLHIGIDFDWAFGSLVGIAGLAAGLAAAPLFSRRPASGRKSRGLIAAVIIVVLLGSGGLGRALDPQSNDPLMGAPKLAFSCSTVR